jgi:hypothetical protein
MTDAEIASIRQMLSCGRTWFSHENFTVESFLYEEVVGKSLHLDAVTFENVRYEAVYSYQRGYFMGVMLRWDQDGPVDVGYMHGNYTDFDHFVPLPVRELLWRF